MTTSVVKLAALRDLVEAQSIRAATIVGERGGWAVEVRYGQTVRVLAGKDGDPRVFTKLDTAARQLLDLGIAAFDVQGADYVQAQTRPARPDRSAAMKHANEYAHWLKGEVQHTLDRLERGEAKVYTQSEADLRWEAKRDEIERMQKKSQA